MAAKHLVSMLHLVTTTGVSQTTLSTLPASGLSREFPEFAGADAAVFYIDCSAGTGTTPTLQFLLQEQDPATGVFFTPPDAPVIPLITTAVITPATTGFRFVNDPCIAACYQLSWVITGTTPSYSASVVAQLITRGR